ncbi:hypothetical protein A0256_08560 [Mucilaginibacter sp. PAMC 26640]|nr:hypothetical protein A0256_08560 [Mucilaginibacter sp. PAMC 26640]
MQPPGFDNLVSASNATYILVVNGKPEGPFSIAELQLRKIAPGDFVKTAAMDDYQEAHEVAELRQLFGFSKQPLPLQYFGSFDQRAIATVIDWLIVSAAFILAAFAVMLILLLALSGDENKTVRIGASIAILALIPLGKLIYNTRMDCGPRQGTLGKQLMKIRVCDIYGERISSSKSFNRNIAKILSTATFFVGYGMCFFTKKQQCLHDLIADTLVIKDRLDS